MWFVDNNRSGGQSGSGVFVCCGSGNGLSISDNLFTGHSSAAVDTAGDASGRPPAGGSSATRASTTRRSP